MKTILRKFAPDAQDRRDFRRMWQAAKFGVKLSLSVVAVLIGICMTTSFIGLMVAGDFVPSALDRIWDE